MKEKVEKEFQVEIKERGGRGGGGRVRERVSNVNRE